MYRKSSLCPKCVGRCIPIFKVRRERERESESAHTHSHEWAKANYGEQSRTQADESTTHTHTHTHTLTHSLTHSLTLSLSHTHASARYEEESERRQQDEEEQERQEEEEEEEVEQKGEQADDISPFYSSSHSSPPPAPSDAMPPAPAIPAHPLAHELEHERGRETERERALLGTIHNGGSRASPAHRLLFTTLRSASPHELATFHALGRTSQVLEGEEEAGGEHISPQGRERELEHSHAPDAANSHAGRLVQAQDASERTEGEGEESVGEREEQEQEQEEEQGLLLANALATVHPATPALTQSNCTTSLSHTKDTETHRTPPPLPVLDPYPSLTRNPQTQDTQSYRANTQDTHTSPHLTASHLAHVGRPHELRHYSHTIAQIVAFTQARKGLQEVCAHKVEHLRQLAAHEHACSIDVLRCVQVSVDVIGCLCDYMYNMHYVSAHSLLLSLPPALPRPLTHSLPPLSPPPPLPHSPSLLFLYLSRGRFWTTQPRQRQRQRQ